MSSLIDAPGCEPLRATVELSVRGELLHEELVATFVAGPSCDHVDVSVPEGAFLVSGNVVSKVQPVAAGHLITVTGTFRAPYRPVSVTLQTVVNNFSGGQQ